METEAWVHHLEERISLPTATAILGCSVAIVLGLLCILIYRLVGRKSSSSSSSSSSVMGVADPVAMDDYCYYENYNTNIIIPAGPMIVGSSRCGSGISIISSSSGGGGREILVKDFLIQSLRWSEPLRCTITTSTDTSVEDGDRDCCGRNRKWLWWWWWSGTRRRETDSMMMKLMSRRHQGCDNCSCGGVERCWPGRRSKPPVWQRPILMGEKCELPRFSGLILYDERGQPLQHQSTTPYHHHQQVPPPRRAQGGVGGGKVAVTLEDLFTSTNYSSDRSMADDSEAAIGSKSPNH